MHSISPTTSSLRLTIASACGCLLLAGPALALAQGDVAPPAAPRLLPAPDVRSAPASAFETVEIDDYLQRNQPPTRNGRMIVPLRGVRFDATISAPPEQREISYLYTALQVMGVKDMPKVHNRLVLSTPVQHRPFAVYVPDDLLDRLRNVQASRVAQFTGFHVYTYANGPAILLTGVELR